MPTIGNILSQHRMARLRLQNLGIFWLQFPPPRRDTVYFGSRRCLHLQDRQQIVVKWIQTSRRHIPKYRLRSWDGHGPCIWRGISKSIVHNASTTVIDKIMSSSTNHKCNNIKRVVCITWFIKCDFTVSWALDCCMNHTSCGPYFREVLSIPNYSRTTSTKSPSFCMTTFRASLTNLTALLPHSHYCNCYVIRIILATSPLWM